MQFYHGEGFNYIVENGPWMVSNKPFFVQKWDINMSMDKTEPTSLPIWVKLTSVPLEAWTTNGISAISSRIGKPMIMDSVTNKMCKMGLGKVGYARVLIEVSAKKELPDSVEIV